MKQYVVELTSEERSQLQQIVALLHRRWRELHSDCHGPGTNGYREPELICLDASAG